MSVIKRKDVFDDDLLKAPGIMTKELEKMLTVVDKIRKSGSDMSEKVTATKSTNDLKKATAQLTDEQRELIKVQGAIDTALAKNNKEYEMHHKILQGIQKEQKAKQVLGEKEVKTVNAETASINQLRVALDKNRQAYANMRTETERNSKEGKELLTIIQKQDSEYKQLRQSMGQNQDSVGDYSSALKNLKAELKSVQGELIGLEEGSEAYIEASKRAGELADKVGDIKDNIKASAGDTSIEQLGSRFGLLGDKIRTLDFEGAKNQIQNIAKISKTMNFKEAISGAGGFTKSLGTLGKAIFTNPLFIVAAVVALVGIAIYKLKDSIKPLTIAFDAMGKGLDWVVQQLKDFSDWLGISSFAADERADAIVEAAKKEQDALEKRYTREIKLATAAGKDVTKLEQVKYRALLDSVNAQIKALEDKKARGSKIDEEELEGYIDRRKDLQNEIDVLAIKAQKDQEARDKVAADKRKELFLREKQDYKNLVQFKLAQEEEFQKSVINDADFTLETRLEAAQKLMIAQSQAARTEMEFSLKATELTESGKLLIKEKFRAENEKIDKEYFDNLFTIQKAATKKEIDESALSNVAKVKLQKSFLQATYEAQNSINKKIEEGYAASLQLRKDQTAFFLTEAKFLYDQYAANILNLFASLAEGQLMNLEMQQRANKTNLEKDLLAVGLNEDAKSAIKRKAAKEDEKIEKQKLEIRRRMAVLEKANAIFSTGLNIAMGIANALSKVATIPLVPIIASLGAIQLAAIIAKPIPKFAKGGRTTTDVVIAGEEGSELYRTPSGQFGLTPDKSTVMGLPKGTEIFPADDTVRMLALSSLGREALIQRENSQLYNEIKSLKKVTKEYGDKMVNAIHESSPDLVRQGSLVYQHMEDSQGNKKIVRKRIMG